MELDFCIVSGGVLAAELFADGLGEPGDDLGERIDLELRLRPATMFTIWSQPAVK